MLILTFQALCILEWITDLQLMCKILTVPGKENTKYFILEVYIKNQETNEIVASKIPIFPRSNEFSNKFFENFKIKHHFWWEI